MDSESLLAKLLEHGIIKASDIRDIETMNKKSQVLKKHPYAISQGRGKDKRWFTYIDTAKGRKKVGKKTEENIIDYLYDLYYGKDPHTMTIPEIYPEWFEYKKAPVSRLNTLRRYDNDYKRFYENEPLAEELMTTPVTSLKKIMVEKWAYALIHKYNMTSRMYLNMMTPLRQMLDYMIDKEVIAVNPARQVHIGKGHFRPDRKKPARTQVYFEDEEKRLVEASYKLAEEYNDELYLSIPLCFYTGLRLGEVLGLGFDDFDAETHLIHVHRSLVEEMSIEEGRTWGKSVYRVEEYLKKNAEERFVVAPDVCFELVENIKLIKNSKHSKSELLFNVRANTYLHKRLSKVCRRVEVDEKSPHKIRKTYISKLINRKEDLDFVREQVGHKELQTTLNSYAYSTVRAEKHLENINRIF